MYIDVLLGSLAIQLPSMRAWHGGSAAFALVVAVVVSVANVINFVLAAIWIRVRLGTPMAWHPRELRPGSPVDHGPQLAGRRAGHLLRASRRALSDSRARTSGRLRRADGGASHSQQRREELEKRTLQLASLQLGVLVTMLRTLSLRDLYTARHSAAVARYAYAVARAAGCWENELRTVHTAGLLHDIGKFAFPDSILLADSRLSDTDYQIVRQHPVHGADLVRRIEGYEEIASVILADHERVDGTGYPYGLRGEQIPSLARMVSVADIYASTARDTYRHQISRSDAIAELRRVAGSQLDGRFVELFIEILENEGLGFTHTEDADFEKELALEERIRELAKPQVAVGGG